jgi:hypothetical protein
MSLGKLAAEGDATKFAEMRRCASDPRWRIREAVATGLQYAADTQMDAVLRELRSWASGNWYEKRAAAAALCEPRLLKSSSTTNAAVRLLDRVTRSMLDAADRSDDGFRALRQGMAYCWSVAVVAAPEQGKPLLEKWLDTRDPDIRWLLQQNLGKARLTRMDAMWVQGCIKRLNASAAGSPRPRARNHPKESR